MPAGISGRAAELIFRAWDAKTEKTRVKLAREALEIDRDAVDAYILLGQYLPSTAERLAMLREGVSRGCKIWAAEMKRPSENYFWLDIDTRSFMRAVHLFALALWDEGDRVGAIAQAKLLLRLNPNDNQGIRELLWAWYPAIGDWAATENLLKRYRKDRSTACLYTKWLLAFRRGEPTDACLAEAMKANPHVPLFLADPDLPVEEEDERLALRGYVTVGSAGDAADYAALNREAWLGIPGAIDRLAAEAAEAKTTA